MRLGNTDEGPAEDPECGRPLDLSALRADDALLDALGAGLVRPGEPYPGCAESDRELVAMLAAWVAEVRPDEAEPLPELDPLTTPTPTSRRARPRLAAVPSPAAEPTDPLVPAPVPDQRRGLLAIFGRRLAAAALLIGLASSGLAAGVAGTDPGASSPAVSRVSFAERARSIAAAAQVTDDLASARTALEQGRRDDAARLIASIGTQLPAVRDDDGRTRLDRDHRRLSEVLAASGGPPAAGELVLAGRAPTVEPSDFLGNLVNDNDVLAGVSPTTAGSAGTDPVGSGDTTVLAEGEGTSTTTDKPTTSAERNPAAAVPTTSDEQPADGQAASGAGPGSTEGSTSETSSGSTSESTSPSSSGSGSTSSPAPTTDGSSPAGESTTSTEPTTTGQRPSTTPEATATSPERPSSSASSSSAAGGSAIGNADTGSREEPGSPTGARASNPAASPAGTPDQPGTTGRKAAAREPAGTTTSRPKSTSPRSRDFIGPVQGRTTDGFSASATRPSRVTTTGRGSTADQTRSTTARTSRSSTENRSTGGSQSN